MREDEDDDDGIVQCRGGDDAGFVLDVVVLRYGICSVSSRMGGWDRQSN